MIRSCYHLYQSMDQGERYVFDKFVPKDKKWWPDLVIAPDGNPYLYRWWVTEYDGTKGLGGVYFHVQVASDPERPLHDHPWDNFSNILIGGYHEVLQMDPPNGPVLTYVRSAGDVIYRPAKAAHRLILPPEHRMTMTLFAHGRNEQKWGFYYPEGKVPYTEVTQVENGVSVHVGRKEGLETRGRDKSSDEGGDREAANMDGDHQGIPECTF